MRGSREPILAGRGVMVRVKVFDRFGCPVTLAPLQRITTDDENPGLHNRPDADPLLCRKMNRLLAALSIWLCSGATVARTPKPTTADTYCPFVVEAAAHALWQFEKDECGFAFDGARKDGITYAEAVGFDPMPSETITCHSPGWIIQIGQHPPKAPTASVVLIGFGPERKESREFDVRDENSNWRETKLVTVHNGCGGIEGIVSRRGGKWSAKTTRENE